MSKIQSESNSQLVAQEVVAIAVVTNMSKIQSESNSQRMMAGAVAAVVVTNMSKIQSESNSQLETTVLDELKGCDQYVKDTI